MVKAIIPCAGYGTRMGMEPHQSKELLEDPNDRDMHLIDYSLNLCYKYNIDPIVITRSEKRDLIDYILNYQKQVELIVLNKPGKEWAETVLKSQGLWGDKNILLLPDTRFEPEISIKRIVDGLNEYQLVAGVHEIPAMDCDKWGIISRTVLWEKPFVANPKIKAYMKAWGILGFSKTVGADLFANQNKGQAYNLPVEPTFIHLDKFVDVSRSGKLEVY